MSQDRNESEPIRDRSEDEHGPRPGVSRRALLSGGAALATLAVTGARAQYTGISPEGGTVPFRQPLGSLNFLDRNQYIHNMEIVSHLKDTHMQGGEPMMNMWARGERRLIAAREGWIDVTDAKKPTLVPMKSRVQGCIAYNDSLDKWLMVSTASQPLSSANPQYPHGRYHPELFRKTVAYDGLRGIRTYDITNPEDPKLLDEFSTGTSGSGTHMNFYDGGRYAVLDAGWSEAFRMENPQRPNGNGFMLVDLSDPANVKEVSRWHMPGQLYGEETEYKKYWFAGDQSSWTSSHGAIIPQRLEDGGHLAYCGFGHFGMVTMDLRDVRKPKVLSRLQWDFETMGGIPYHSIYPVIGAGRNERLQNLIVATPETVEPDCREPYKPGQIINIKDPANPRIIGLFPRPKPPKEAPYNDFCLSRGRVGIHNTQAWVAPGNARAEIMVLACFNAGIRVFDISDPTAPREVGYFIPPRTGEIDDYDSWRRAEAETCFVEWDRNMIWLGGPAGTYGLSCPALGRPSTEPRKIANWSVPHANRGWDG
jgi:hypothetical protein